jgi:glycosyltransferase involved in cell wall biosynthesis
LADSGYSVTVICPKRRGERWCEQFGAVTAYQYPPPPEADGVLGYLVEYVYTLLATTALMLWVALRQGFDVLHAHNPPDLFVLLAILCRPFGTRFVYDQHDLSSEMYRARFDGACNPLLYRALQFFERLSCRWADLVIATNESYKQIQIERSGIDTSRVVVVRNGPESWHLRQFDTSQTRSDSSIAFGYVGVMGHQDGVDYLLRALHALRQVYGRTDWRCLLIGSGDAMHDLQQLAASLGIADRLLFTGWTDYEKVPRYLADTDICVAPDPSSAYNDRSTIVKIMEYMAQAKPVVAFDLAENRVTAGDTALYAKPNDEQELARLMLRLMDDGALRKTMGEAGHRRLAQGLMWEHQQTHLLAAYDRMFAVKQAVADHAFIAGHLLDSSSHHLERGTCVAD